MSAFSSPDRRADDRCRGVEKHAPFARAFVSLLVLFLGTLSVLPADARTRTHSSQGGRLDVVSSSGDTIRIERPVKGVTISGEGIRIQGDQHTIVKVPGHPDIGDIDVDVELDDSSMRAMGYGRHGSGDIVQMFQDVNVPKTMNVNGDVIALFGDVKVEGSVQGQVMSLLGSVELADSARVGGDVVTVGGTLHASPTSEVQGQTVSMPVFGPPRMARWLPGAAMIASVFFFALLGALVALLFPERLVRVATTVSRRTFLSFLLGLLAFPLLPVVVVILCITVVGIPVAVLLLFLFPVAAFVGYVSSCALMGARLVRQEVTDMPVWKSVILGLVFVGVFFVIGGILSNMAPGGGLRVIGFSFMGLGLLIGSVSALLGLGALIVSRLGEPERETKSLAVPPKPQEMATLYAPPTP